MPDIIEGVAKAIESGRYYNDPAAWLDKHIIWRGGDRLADYQRDIVSAIPEKKRVAVRSLHGAGKTATAALVTIWFAITREQAGVDWKVLTTASAWRHLNLYLWPEVHKWLKLVKWHELGMSAPEPRTQLLDMRLKLQNGAASAVASDEAVNIEGAHADSILYVFDESKAIPPETWDAAEGALSGDGEGYYASAPEAFALAISTPGAPSGRFYDIHARKPGLEDWYPIHVKLEDAIKAKRVGRRWAEQRKLQFGADSAVYKNRVEGEFASTDEDTVVPLPWVELAIERWHEWDDAERPVIPEGNVVLSIDVARGGADDTVIAFRRGQTVTGIKRVNKRDTMSVTAQAQRYSSEVDAMYGIVPDIVVDTVGVGAGVYDRLKELGYKVHPHTGSQKAHIRDITGTYGFTNVRSAAYWSLREMLDPANGLGIALPDDDRLVGELTGPTWDLTTGAPPKIKVEPKEDVHKRLGRSPDAADSIVMNLYRERIRRPSEAISGASTFARADIVTEGPFGRQIARSPYDGLEDRILTRW